MSPLVHKDTEELHPRTLERMEEVAKRVELTASRRGGIPTRTDLGDEADQYVKVPDTSDVWFDSGFTDSSLLTCVRNSPVTQRTCIWKVGPHRGWFMSSLMISTAMKGKAPYRQVLTDGLPWMVRDGCRNPSATPVSPQDVMNKLGADILRLWVASTDYTGEMAVSN
ncbi:class I tRNA ligase family protein [Escherichia coli]